MKQDYTFILVYNQGNQLALLLNYCDVQEWIVASEACPGYLT